MLSLAPFPNVFQEKPRLMQKMAMRWKKHKILGAGTYGTVHLATPLDCSSLAAVKSADFDSSSSLKEEAVFLQKFRGNPYIIQSFGQDVSIEEGQMFYNLILEYAAGGSLADLMMENKGTMSESEIAFYSSMLLRGISAIHDRDIVHSDLKPGNVLVFPTPGGMNQLKIADFGLAKNEWKKRVLYFSEASYAAPESTAFGVQYKASDIWSVGCIVLEMITGEPIWSYRNLEELWEKLPESLSEYGRDFLKRCLIKNHEMRWTANKLMYHPFIEENLINYMLNGNHSFWQPSSQSINPFGRWVSTTCLFSATAAVDEERCSRPLSSYILSPEYKTRESPQLLGIPCGFSLEDFLNLTDYSRW